MIMYVLDCHSPEAPDVEELFISTKSTSAMVTVPPPLERHAPPAPTVSRIHQRTQCRGDPLPYVDHDRQADVPLHPVSAPIQQTSTPPSSSSTGAWHYC